MLLHLKAGDGDLLLITEPALLTRCAWLSHTIHFDLNINNVAANIRCICGLHMWYSPKWRQGDAKEANCWINSLFLFSLRTKYSRYFVKLRLNHWCHMDYFTDVLATVLVLDHVRILAVYGRVRELSEFIKYILILQLWNDMRWLTNDIIYIFGRTIPLIYTVKILCILLSLQYFFWIISSFCITFNHPSLWMTRHIYTGVRKS